MLLYVYTWCSFNFVGSILILFFQCKICWSYGAKETTKSKSSCTEGVDRIEKTLFSFLQLPASIADYELVCVYMHNTWLYFSLLNLIASKSVVCLSTCVFASLLLAMCEAAKHRGHWRLTKANVIVAFVMQIEGHTWGKKKKMTICLETSVVEKWCYIYWWRVKITTCLVVVFLSPSYLIVNDGLKPNSIPCLISLSDLILYIGEKCVPPFNNKNW